MLINFYLNKLNIKSNYHKKYDFNKNNSPLYPIKKNTHNISFIFQN